MRKIIIIVFSFIVLLGALFGPKVSGYVDFSVLSAVFSSLLFISSYSIRFVDIKFFRIMAILILVVCWSLFVWGLNSPGDFYLPLRTARAFLAVIFLYPFFYYLSSRGILSSNNLFFILVSVLYVQVFTIYAQIAFPQTQTWLAPLYGFDKPLREFRAFGLSAGYDSAGFITVFLSSLMLAYSLRFRSRVAFIGFIVSSGAVLFTSRSSILLLFGVIVMILVIFRTDIAKNIWNLVAMAVLFLWVLTLYVIPIFSSTLEFVQMSNLGSRQIVIGMETISQFARTDPLETADQMIVIPEKLLYNIFGTGSHFPDSDIGYIQSIYMGGWILLLGYIMFYIYLYVCSSNLIHRVIRDNITCLYLGNWMKIWSVACLSVLIVMLLGNLKNLYFFTRGYHELAIVVTAIIGGLCSKVLRQRANVGYHN